MESDLSVTPSKLADVQGGEQLLIALDGGKFDYGWLPSEAFENLFVVSVGREPRKIQQAVEQQGANPRRVGVVPVTGSPVDYDGPLWLANRVGPMDLTGISIEFSRGFSHLTTGEGWMVLDSVSILLMYAGTDRVFRLLDSIASACRSRDLRGLYVVDKKALTPETMNTLRGLFDSTIEFD